MLIHVTAFVFRFGTPKIEENNAPVSIEEISKIRHNDIGLYKHRKICLTI